jgi:hypothetical protein
MSSVTAQASASWLTTQQQQQWQGFILTTCRMVQHPRFCQQLLLLSSTQRRQQWQTVSWSWLPTRFCQAGVSWLQLKDMLPLQQQQQQHPLEMLQQLQPAT